MKKFFTFEATIANNHGLVKTGPYAIVRHPGYAAYPKSVVQRPIAGKQVIAVCSEVITGRACVCLEKAWR